MFELKYHIFSTINIRMQISCFIKVTTAMVKYFEFIDNYVRYSNKMVASNVAIVWFFIIWNVICQKTVHRFFYIQLFCLFSTSNKTFLLGLIHTRKIFCSQVLVINILESLARNYPVVSIPCYLVDILRIKQKTDSRYLLPRRGGLVLFYSILMLKTNFILNLKLLEPIWFVLRLFSYFFM